MPDSESNSSTFILGLRFDVVREPRLKRGCQMNNEAIPCLEEEVERRRWGPEGIKERVKRA